MASAGPNISVNIDGEVYNCTPGASSGTACESQAAALKSKFSACLKAYTASTCFNDTFSENENYCGAAAEVCNSSCLKAYTASTCYQACY